MKNLFKKVISLAAAGSLLLTACPSMAEETVQPELVAKVKNIITVDGYQFKDLNDNGTLDVYEDWRKTPEERADDLLSQMDASQKAKQMVHLTLVSKKDSWFASDNVGFALVYEYVFDSAYDAAVRTNEIQELSESSPLGIPVIFSMDTEAGAAFVKDGTFLPDEINQGAVNDPELVKELNIVLREELKAIGVRMALSPDADLISDPRWGRNQECYSEDTDVVSTLIVAAIEGLQDGNALTENSVIATVKHFPGSGAQTDGLDGTPLTGTPFLLEPWQVFIVWFVFPPSTLPVVVILPSPPLRLCPKSTTIWKLRSTRRICALTPTVPAAQAASR